jgi:hypothetical protein
MVFGAIVLLLGAWGMIGWWPDFGGFLRGFIPLLLALVGLAAIGAGFRGAIGGAEQEVEEKDADGSAPANQG